MSITAKSGSDTPMWIENIAKMGPIVANAIGSNSQGYWSKEGSEGVANAVSQLPEMTKLISDITKDGMKGNWGSAAGMVGNLVGGFAEDRNSLSGQYGDLSAGAENVIDGVISAIPGIGQWYALANGLSDFAAGKWDNLSTSGNTKSDAIMDAIPILGLVNAGFGTDMDKLKYDKKAWNRIVGSYAGSQANVKDASENTGGIYGLSRLTGEYRNDMDQNNNARLQQNAASYIGDMANAAHERVDSTLTEATINQKNKLRGQGYVFQVKKGIKLPTAEDIQKVKNLAEKQYEYNPIYVTSTIELFKDGGKPKEKPKTRTLEELIQYAKEQNPRFVQRMTEPLKWLDLDNGNYATHMMAWEYTDDGQAMTFPTVMEDVEGNLQDYKDKAMTEAQNRGDYLIMAPEEAQIFTEGYKQGWPMFFQQTPSQKFAKGGTMNIIPEGELHARLHHIDQEGITKKGIPVISEEEGGEIVQHAEIERNEIIFRLEITKKLEELMQDGSEEAALEAGKLLVYEILENTDDRTNLIDSVI